MVNNYELLANAIVEQAARDYERALCEDHNMSTKETRASIKELERYFKGDLIKLHTQLPGPKLMEMIRADVIECDYDLKAIRHMHSLQKETEES